MACKYPGASKDGLSIHTPLCRPSRTHRGAACPDNTACSAAARPGISVLLTVYVNPAPFPSFRRDTKSFEEAALLTPSKYAN
jgi:hypothetical protein